MPKIEIKPIKSVIEKKDKKKIDKPTAQSSEDGLTIKQKAFCKLFTDGDKEFFGNGVQSYIEVYNPDTSKPNWYKTACSVASEILSNLKVSAYINKLLESSGYSDENVNKQHLFLINQFTDLGTKMRAIAEYNKVKGKYAEDKLNESAREQMLLDIAERKKLRKEKYGNRVKGDS